MAVEALVAAELAEPIEPGVAAAAAALAARYPGAARAVLFYGSCLRERQLDGLMLDFYLIVSDYRSAYGKSWLAPANRLIPPNVFPFEHQGLAAKYAVLSEADFDRECGGQAKTVSVWARFAQPSRLAWGKRRSGRASGGGERRACGADAASPGAADGTGGRTGRCACALAPGLRAHLRFGAAGRAARPFRVDRRHRSRTVSAVR
jgi:hypothetical protein